MPEFTPERITELRKPGLYEALKEAYHAIEARNLEIERLQNAIDEALGAPMYPLVTKALRKARTWKADD